MAKSVLVVLIPLMSFCSMILANTMLTDKTADNNASSTANIDQATRKPLDVNMMDVMNECNDSFRIEMSYLEALNKSGSFPDETDKTPKCYVRCVLEKTGIASEDGEFDAGRAAQVFIRERDGQPVENTEDLAMLCANRQESCKCERSYNFMKCLISLEMDKYEREKST